LTYYQLPQITKPKKSVSFAGTATVIPLVKTPSDLTNAWYDHDEYKRFEASRRMTIDAINTVQGDLSQLDPAVHCMLGLEEQLTRKQALVRKLKSSHYTQLVLEQLKRSKQLGSSGPYSASKPSDGELLALSSMLSRHASHRAQWRALAGRADSSCSSS
jgi:hypothetical protein